MTLCHTSWRRSCLLSPQRQRLINSADGVSSKPLQNGRHENIENGNVPVENPEDPPREPEQQPPPPPEPEPVEAAFLSPFSVPGEFCGAGLHGDRAQVFRMGSWTREGGEGGCEGSTLGHWVLRRHPVVTPSALNRGSELQSDAGTAERGEPVCPTAGPLGTWQVPGTPVGPRAAGLSVAVRKATTTVIFMATRRVSTPSSRCTLFCLCIAYLPGQDIPRPQMVLRWLHFIQLTTSPTHK